MCDHLDYPCCGCGNDDLTPGDNCCPDCGQPDCFGSCCDGDGFVPDHDDNCDCDECRLTEGEYEGNEDMDGDFDSAMTSAGFGTDEDYNHYACDDGGYFDETPLGHEYDGE